MPQTTTPPEPSAEDDPTGILMTRIVSLLAPMFLPAGGTIADARIAATETVYAYCSRNHADLLAVAQIIGFGLAALGSLSLSMTEDPSPSMMLRLRNNASALNRAAEQNRRVRQAGLSRAPAPQISADPPVARTPKPAAAKTANTANHDIWALAMAAQASEITASIPNLPPAERSAASVRAAALSSTANSLLNDAIPRSPRL